ncbi:putative serine/threonine-protein kinase PIX13, partial [Sesamum angolense]
NAAVEPLSWDLRLKIAIGAARGLAFLHTSDKQVIYRDFKASNILLDGVRFFNIMLLLAESSFLCFGCLTTGDKLDWGEVSCQTGALRRDSHVTTRVMGTYGYAAPEYVATGHLYVKSDVYGFGVVLLEMLTGMRALDTRRPSGQHNLVDWLKPFLSQRRKLKYYMDARMEGQYSSKAALQASQLTLRCLEGEPRKRPSMKKSWMCWNRLLQWKNQKNPRIDPHILPPNTMGNHRDLIAPSPKNFVNLLLPPSFDIDECIIICKTNVTMNSIVLIVGIYVRIRSYTE